jgi:hypothetical protein
MSHFPKTSVVATLIASGLALAALAAADGGHPHDSTHAAGVDRRGDQTMGFSHEKTAHHFGLTAAGGFISAESRTAADAGSRDAIVRHFHHIARAFRQGDFAMPMFIHDRVPPGVEEMKRRSGEISYEVEETPLGARVVISTRNPRALEAIHQFLRFQIEDHRTGDSVEVQR